MGLFWFECREIKITPNKIESRPQIERSHEKKKRNKHLFLVLLAHLIVLSIMLSVPVCLHAIAIYQPGSSTLLLFVSYIFKAFASNAEPSNQFTGNIQIYVSFLLFFLHSFSVFSLDHIVYLSIVFHLSCDDLRHARDLNELIRIKYDCIIYHWYTHLQLNRL